MSLQEQIVWRGFTRAELDAAYNNAAAIENSTQLLAEWAERAAAFRARHPELLDLVYGPRPRNRIDLFRCGLEQAPLFVFIHGGYWQSRAKEVFSHMAAGPLARGMDVAMLGYTLAPDATLTEIVAEIHAAIRWLRREGPRHGVGRAQLIVSGWSAGGHLTATAMPLSEVDAGLAISGIFDVEPCRLNYLNEKLKLTTEEAAAMSPIRHLPERKRPLIIAYGKRELPELQRQSCEYWRVWSDAGGPGRLLPLDHHHISILDELASTDGELARAAQSLVR
ncbi:MAG TPA: alpha/beta hydrolase [Xanthobacteraceae bacterium]|nr:alpha/beta hydrolase [Xanthobacteraceae bacterium]